MANVRSATLASDIPLPIQSPITNCKVPETQKAPNAPLQMAGWDVPLLDAKTTPAANPIVPYPIRMGSDALNALKNMYLFRVMKNRKSKVEIQKSGEVVGKFVCLSQRHRVTECTENIKNVIE